MKKVLLTTDDPLSEVDPRVLGARLREAREAKGWTQSKISKELGVARTTMVAIEKGERGVSSEELVQLARLYGRRLSDVLQHGVPADGFVVQLRGTLSEKKLADSDLIAGIEELEALCENYIRLEGLRSAPLRRRYPPTYDLEDVDVLQAAEDIAAEERRRLGLGGGPLLNLREVLEVDVGLRIFLIRLPHVVAGMYAYSQPFGGCMGINRDHPPERRRYTQAHEYGHFLTSRFRGEVIREGRYERRPREERFAEAFARAFLMPRGGLRRRFLDLQRERRGAISRGDLLRLAHSFVVSAEAMVRRLEELSLVPVGTWDRLGVEGLRIREAQRLLGLKPPPEEEYLPERYVALAVEAWENGDLSEGQAARVLRETRLEVRDRVEPSFGDVEELGTLQLGAPLVA